MAKELKYTTDGKYSVFAGKIEIARSVIDPLTTRRYDVQILQGMDRAATIAKICSDCPSFAEENGITTDYWPSVFPAKKKGKR